MDKILCSLLCLFFIMGLIFLLKKYSSRKEPFDEDLFDLKKSFCKYYRGKALELKDICPKFKEKDCNDCCVWSNNQCVIGNEKYGPLVIN